MNKYIYIIIGVALFLTESTTASAQVSNDNEDEVNKVSQSAVGDYVPGEVLVKFKDDNRIHVRRSRGQLVSTNSDRITAVLQKFGVNEMEQLLPNQNPKRKLARVRAYNGDYIQEHDLSQLYHVRLSAAHQQETQQAVDELKGLDEVEFAEPNYKIYMMADTHIADNYSGNPMESQQWYLDSYGVKDLWNKPIINKERPIIAILDTGVDLTHPDLKDNLWTNTAEAYGVNDKDNDGNGFNNDVHGWDFVNNSGNIRDNNMHGTHVAGIAAAANNGIGIVGANPLALIMPITVLQSDGAGDVATIVKGIDYAVQNGATVLNMSFGLYTNSRVLRQALESAYQKAVLVAAAGNEGRCIYASHWGTKHEDPEPKSMPCFPAAYSFVLGVQATEKGGGIATFSNYDDDGPFFSCESSYLDPDGFNYELKAPGKKMLSTIPEGNYKELNGTSMAAPLVAGAISALKMVKEYDSQEILWGDLLHTDNIAQAYNLTTRPAELDMIRVELRERKDLANMTEDDYGGDNEVDAGETINIYPVIRSTFGVANNIKLKLMVDEFEDPNVVEIIKGDADFGIRLDAYGKAVSVNPLVLKVPKGIADARHIRLKVVATCDNIIISKEAEFPFTLIAHNMIKISGLINEDMTLTSDHVYYINGSLGVNKGVTLTIEPGTRVEFAGGTQLASFGKLVANGTPENPIIFTRHMGESVWNGISTYSIDGKPRHPSDTLRFCILEDCARPTGVAPYMIDCVLRNYGGYGGISYASGERNLITESIVEINNPDPKYTSNGLMKHTNIVNNDMRLNNSVCYSYLVENNFFNNFEEREGKMYSLSFKSNSPALDHSNYPSYLGTAREDLVRPYLYEMGNAINTWGSFDLSNMPTEPIRDAHGIVWKVLVNGKDAQDEFEELTPLGVGKHKFQVYFSRPMNKKFAPQISFGVREPYTQQSVAEDGCWNAEGTVYTAYKTITGKTNSDGLNRIYVQGAKDNEYFECPYEKVRFNIIVQAAGSMSIGFVAEEGLGRISLKWNNERNNFEDAMGFNVYRYQYIDLPSGYRDGSWHYAETVCDTVRLNQNILDIETTAFVDYDVTPDNTYYYYYKVLSTDLQEYDMSNVVSATPLTSKRGDANGDQKVDVLDVMTTVNFITRNNPKPFIFEAADMNTDAEIDILDVVSIVRGVLNPSLLASATAEHTATYWMENDTLYMDSPVALGGVQVQLALGGKGKKENVGVALDLDGFEHTSAWLSDNDYLFLAYNMNGKALTAGKHALLHIKDAEISSIRLSDISGRKISATNVNGNKVTSIGRMGKDVMNVKGVYDLQGRKITISERQNVLPHGIYIIDGKKVIK